MSMKNNLKEMSHRLVKNPLPVDKIQSGGKIMNVHQDHSSFSIGHNIIDSFSPLGTSSILQNTSSRVEYQIFSSRINKVKAVLLELVIANNDPTNSLELVSPYFLANEIDILIDNSIQQSFYPEGLLMAHRYMTQEQQRILCRMTNLLYSDTLTGRTTSSSTTGSSPGTANPILIGPNQSRTIYIPVNNTMFEQSQVPFSSIKSTIRFRFTFNTFTEVTTTTNLMTNPANLGVNSQQLYIIGEGLSNPGSEQINNLVLDTDYSANYYVQERQIISNASTNVTSRPQISLTNLNGCYAAILVMLRDLSPTKEMQYQWKFLNTAVAPATNNYNPTQFLITNCTLFDSNGTPWSLNNLSYGLSKYTSALISGSPGQNANYSEFSDKFSFVQWDLTSDQWASIRAAHGGGIVINNAYSLAYNIYTNPATELPYAFTPFSGPKDTESVIIGDRLYSLILQKDGRLFCKAQ